MNFAKAFLVTKEMTLKTFMTNVGQFEKFFFF